MPQTRAIFLDRDGVLLEDREDFISSLSSVKILPQVGDAISNLRDLGFKIFLISNQTVVARGILSYEEMLSLNKEILNLVQKQNPNAVFDDIFICPHHPKANIERYRQDCSCRKPKPGMILEAQKKHHISLESSVVIGDRFTDVYAGKSVGCKGILLANANEKEKPLIETSLKLNPLWLKPDYTFSTLLEASAYIRSHL